MGTNTIKELKDKISLAVRGLYGREYKDFEVSVPENPQWGDYSSNIALQLASEIKQNPREIAKNISYRLEDLYEEVSEEDIPWDIEIAGVGFINFKLRAGWLQNILSNKFVRSINYGEVELMENLAPKETKFSNKKIMVEYTDPNPFKLFHIGHLIPNAVGESFSRLFNYLGADIRRASYQGDAGMHVAKSIWGMIKKLEEETLSLEEISTWDLKKRVGFLGKCYALGATAYKEETGKAQAEIKDINYMVYMSAQERLKDEENWVPQVNYKKYLEELDLDYDLIKRFYNEGRRWSLDYFETVYEILGTEFDYYYFESMTGEYGYKVVQEHLDRGVFQKDNGAVIFKGDDYGLHTRVFINSQGLPTYEAKDLGLAYRKKEDFDYDLSYIITAVEQQAYFEVVFKALEQIEPSLAHKQIHVSNGMLNFTEGKMSSRTGNIISVEELISQLTQLAYERTAQNISGVEDLEKKVIAQNIAVAAVKYAILKQQLGKNIAYDREKSLQLRGNTGPYLQYTFVRTYSVLERSDFKCGKFDIEKLNLLEEEELLLRKLIHFNEEVIKSADELMPSYLCTYLHELAQLFNSFYSEAPILDAESEELRSFRLWLVNGVGITLRTGLYLLGISTVEKM